MLSKQSMQTFVFSLILGMMSTVGGFAVAPTTEYSVAPSASAIQPLLVGSQVPAVTIQTADGKATPLGDLLEKQPSVILFFRGLWCPYCNTHLGRMQEIEADLKKLGYQILAISPEKAANLQPQEEKEAGYTLLSDDRAEAAKAFGVAFRVADKTYNLYKNKFNLDLEARSGQLHHILPVPAVFIVDKEGKVHFQHADPDYKQRLDPAVILAAARAALSTE